MDEHTRFHFSPIKGIFFTLVLLTLGFILAFALGVITTALITGDWSLATNLNSNYLDSLRIMQILQTTGMFIFPAVVMALLSSKKPWKWLGFEPVQTKQALIALVMMMALLPGINLIASLNAQLPVPQWMIQMEETAEQLLKSLMITDSFGTFSVNLFMVAIIPAIGEELFFRSLLQKYLIGLTKSNTAGIVIASLIFSAIHMQFLGFIPRFLLGMVFGYLYLWTGTILIPMLVHFINNGLAVFLYYLVGLGSVPESVEHIGAPSQGWVLGVISLILGGYLLWVLRDETANRQNRSDQIAEVP